VRFSRFCEFLPQACNHDPPKSILISMTLEDFESIVTSAIENIPKRYKSRIKNVHFVSSNQPSQEQREKLGLRKCDALFGLYEGVPLTKRGGAVHSIIPDTITIFMHPMVDMFADQSSLEKQVYETVWHEVAHYFGLNHSQIHKAKEAL